MSYMIKSTDNMVLKEYSGTCALPAGQTGTGFSSDTASAKARLSLAKLIDDFTITRGERDMENDRASSNAPLWTGLIGAMDMFLKERRSLCLKKPQDNSNSLKLPFRLLSFTLVSLLSTGIYADNNADDLPGKPVSIYTEPTLAEATPIATPANDRRIYLGFGVGRSWLEPDASEVDDVEVTEREQLGGQFTLGKDLGQRFSLEGHFVELGAAGLTDGAEVAYREFGLSGLAYLGRSYARSQREGLFAFGRAGVGFLMNEASDDIEVEQDNSVHLLLGGGLEYATQLGLALRAEFLLIDTDVNYTQLGLIYRFGGAKHSTPAIVDVPEELTTESVKSTVETPLPVPEIATKEIATKTVDSDSDGVIDSQDDCKGTQAGIAVDAAGCAVFSGTLEGVNFNSGSAVLTTEAVQKLDEVIELLTPYPTSILEVSAHTDSAGSEENNEQLSIDRARAVADYFIKSGISSQRISARAFGESRPIATNTTAEGRRENRRVELNVLSDS